MTKQEKRILRHTVGADSDNPGYRNRYAPAAPLLPTLQRMVKKGLMIRGKAYATGLHIYHATDKGCKAIGLTEKQTIEALTV